MEDRNTTLDELRDRIATGRYEIDPVAVADAIISRCSRLDVAQEASDRPASIAHRRFRGRIGGFGHRRPSARAHSLAA